MKKGAIRAVAAMKAEGKISDEHGHRWRGQISTIERIVPGQVNAQL